MDHVAIMRKAWGLTEKILNGEKKIESRWYKFKHAPWNKIKIGDNVYFKNSGEPVTIKTEVQKVLHISNLTQKRVSELLKKYGKDDGIGKDETSKYYHLFKDKKYCTLVFLKNVQSIKPFYINKRGFGAMSSWISVENITTIIV